MGTTSGYITRNQDLIINMDAANSRSYTSGSTTCECLVSTVLGTFENGTSFSPEFGGGWTFDGTNDYLNLGNRPNINPELDSFTCNIFFKIDPSSTSSNIIASKGNNTTSDIGWLIYYSSTNGVLTVRCNGNNTTSQRAAQYIPINKGQNYMVTMVINRTDNTIKGYLNGSNIGWVNGNYSQSFTGNSISGFGSITNSDDFLIGERPNLNLPMFGTIYFFQTYNFALSESQVYRNFNFFGGRYDLSVPPPSFDTTSFEYDGTDDYQESSGTWSTIDGATNFSVSVWVKVTLGVTSMIAKSYGTGTATNFYMYVATTGMVEVWSAGGGSNWSRSTTNLSDGVWHHIVMTLDRGTGNRYTMQKIYIDGVEGYTSNYFGGTIPTGTTLSIGANPNYTHPAYFYPTNGNINEFAVWGGHTLSPTEITEIYNNGVANDLTSLPTAPSPTNWWRSENAVWNGTYYETPDEMGVGPNLDTSNMVEASRVNDVPV